MIVYHEADIETKPIKKRRSCFRTSAFFVVISVPVDYNRVTFAAAGPLGP
jgi:hypothetical protein